MHLRSFILIILLFTATVYLLCPPAGVLSVEQAETSETEIEDGREEADLHPVTHDNFVAAVAVAPVYNQHFYINPSLPVHTEPPKVSL